MAPAYARNPNRRRTGGWKTPPPPQEPLRVELPPPHPGQQRIIAEHKRFNVVNCGRRWGKTLMGIDRLVISAVQGNRVAWFAPTYRMMLEPWQAVRDLLQPIATRISEQEKRIELSNGGSVSMWSLENPDVVRGGKYKLVIIDEASMIRDLQDAWERVIRPTLVDLAGDAWFLSTPRGPNYFRELFDRGQDAQREDWASWRMPTSTNPFIPPEEIASAKADLPAAVYAQEFEADFSALTDVAFPEFDRRRHVIPTDYEMIARWRRIASHDWGYASPGHHLWGAVDPAGGVVIYREWQFRGLDPAEIAQGILFRQGDEQPITWADPAVWQERRHADLTAEQVATLAQAGRLQLSKFEQYQQAGLHVQPANNQRIAGKQRIHTLLRDRPEGPSAPTMTRTSEGLLIPLPVEAVRLGVPYLRIMDCCPILIDCLANIQTDPDRPEDVRTAYLPTDSLRDDPVDALRYMLMGIPTQATEAPRTGARQPRGWAW